MTRITELNTGLTLPGNAAGYTIADTDIIPITDVSDTQKAASGTTKGVPFSKFKDLLASQVFNYIDNYDANTNTPDLDTSPSGISKNDLYVVSVAGTFFTESVDPGAWLIAKQDNPTALTHWSVIPPVTALATTSAPGIVELATDGENAANVAVQGNDSRLNVVTAINSPNANSLVKLNSADQTKFDTLTDVTHTVVSSGHRITCLNTIFKIESGTSFFHPGDIFTIKATSYNDEHYTFVLRNPDNEAKVQMFSDGQCVFQEIINLVVPLAITNGGTGSATRQGAIDGLTNVAAASENQVLTKSGGLAVFAAPPSAQINNAVADRITTVASTVTQLDGEANLTYNDTNGLRSNRQIVSNVATATYDGLVAQTIDNSATKDLLKLLNSTSSKIGLSVSGTGIITIHSAFSSPLLISNGGTGSATRQGAIDGLTNVAAATEGQVLAKSSGQTKFVNPPVAQINNAVADRVITVASTTTQLDGEANLTFNDTNGLRSSRQIVSTIATATYDGLVAQTTDNSATKDLLKCLNSTSSKIGLSIAGNGVITIHSAFSAPLGIANGGSGQATQQAAINALTNVAAATVGQVLKKVGSDAIFADESGATNQEPFINDLGTVSGAINEDTVDGKRLDFTANGNITSVTITNVTKAYRELWIRMKQDPTGGRTIGTITIDGNAVNNVPTISEAANAVNNILLVQNADDTWDSFTSSFG